MIALSFSVPFENPNFSERQVPLRMRLWFLGMGSPLAAATLEAHLSRERPRLLIISGFAGALHPQIQIGETFLCKNMSDPGAVEALLARGWHPPPNANLHTSDELAADRYHKARLYQVTGSDLVDMETQSLLEVARFHAIPVITIRSVSDSATVDFPLPEDILYDKRRQRARPVALCAYLLFHPKCIPGFLRMLRDLFRARAQLRIHLSTVLKAAGAFEAS